MYSHVWNVLIQFYTNLFCLLFVGTTNSYDFAIRRLKCYDFDEFCGIYPNNYGQCNPESLVFACQFCCKANYQHWLALANEDGMIAIQDTRLKSKRRKSGEIYAEGKTISIMSGHEDFSTIGLWDRQSPSLIVFNH